MKKLTIALAGVYFALAHIALADEFHNVTCGADIPKAMIGQHSANERVVVTEKKYAALGLKDLGADEISADLSSINWRICGSEYIALVGRHGIVGDVLPVPPHSGRAPAFSGRCQVEGKDLPDIIFAILDGTKTADLLPAQMAWKIDQKGAKFVKISSEGLLCPKSGIYTVDGGM